jgi:hypothetical protein
MQSFCVWAAAVAGCGIGGFPGRVGPGASFREASLRGAHVTCLRLLEVSRDGVRERARPLFIGVRNVLFWTEQAPEGRLAADLSIGWPVLLDGRTPLQLYAFGEMGRQSKSSAQVTGQRGIRKNRSANFSTQRTCAPSRGPLIGHAFRGTNVGASPACHLRFAP